MSVKDGDNYEQEYDLPECRFWLLLGEDGYRVVGWDFFCGTERKDQETGQGLVTPFIKENLNLTAVFNPGGPGKIPQNSLSFRNLARRVVQVAKELAS
jgi:hypothetical protein